MCYILIYIFIYINYKGQYRQKASGRAGDEIRRMSLYSVHSNIRYISPSTTKSFQASKESFVRTTTHFLDESAVIFDVFDSVY